MKHFLYARKSTEDEERQVMSIEAQIFELQEYAKREEIKIDETFVESKSAKKPGREVFNQMIEKIHACDEPVIILSWHPDRLARNSVDGGQIIYLIDTGKVASLRFCTFWFESTPQGLFMLQVAFGQSKYYSDNLSENVRRGIRQKLRRGEWPTLAPFGYVNNAKTRNIEPDPVKSRVVKKVFEEFAAGKHTLESLSERLSFWGITSRVGTPLAKSAVKAILTNKVYLGIIEHNGEAYEGKFKALISSRIFSIVQDILNNRAKPRKLKNKHDFPFTGLMKCGECGAAITAQYAHGRGGTYRYYRCTKKFGSCGQGYLQEKILVEQVKDKLRTIAIPEDWASKMHAQVDVWEKEQSRSEQVGVQKYKQDLNETEQKLDMLVNSFLDGTIDKEIYLKKKTELIERKTDLKQKKSVFQQTKTKWIEPLRNFINTAHQAEKLVASNDFYEIKSLAEKIGTNHRLQDRQVNWEIKQPFNLVAELTGNFPPNNHAGPNKNYPLTGKNLESCIWSG